MGYLALVKERKVSQAAARPLLPIGGIAKRSPAATVTTSTSGLLRVDPASESVIESLLPVNLRIDTSFMQVEYYPSESTLASAQESSSEITPELPCTQEATRPYVPMFTEEDIRKIREHDQLCENGFTDLQQELDYFNQMKEDELEDDEEIDECNPTDNQGFTDEDLREFQKILDEGDDQAEFTEDDGAHMYDPYFNEDNNQEAMFSPYFNEDDNQEAMSYSNSAYNDLAQIYDSYFSENDQIRQYPVSIEVPQAQMYPANPEFFHAAMYPPIPDFFQAQMHPEILEDFQNQMDFLSSEDSQDRICPGSADFFVDFFVDA